MYVCTHVLDRVEMFAFVAATAAAAESVGFVNGSNTLKHTYSLHILFLKKFRE